MIVGKVFGLEFFTAILTLESVAGVYILARKLNFALLEANETEQPDDGWNLHGEGNRMNTCIGLLDDLYLLEKKELESLSPIDHIERLK